MSITVAVKTSRPTVHGSHLVGPLWYSAVCGLRHEAERALTADHEALDDLNGVVHREVHKCIQGVARRALDGKLAADEGRQSEV